MGKENFSLFRENFNAIAGLPTSLPASAIITPIASPSGSLYTGIDNALSYPRIFHYAKTPMGVYQSQGVAQSSQSAATDEADWEYIRNQIFTHITPWLTSNDFAGSGAVQNGEKSLGIIGNWFTTNAVNDVDKYCQLLNMVTNPNFKAHTAGGLAGDVDKVAAVIKKVINDAIKVLKTAGEDVAFAPLLLFKGAMKAEIIKKNGSYSGDGTILDITAKFLKALGEEHQASHFDSPLKHHHKRNKQSFDVFNVDDGFGMEVAPSYISAPVKIATSAIGLGQLPGAPPYADLLWNFFHKEANKPNSPVAVAVTKYNKAAKGEGEKLTFDLFGKKVTIGAWLQGSKGVMVITGIIVVIIIIKVMFFHKKK